MRKSVFSLLLASILMMTQLSSNIALAYVREPNSIQRATTVLIDSSNAFEKGQILSPELIQTYNLVKIQNKKSAELNVISDQASQFVGKNTNDASLLVADRYANYWWNQSDAKNSSFGQKIEFVESGMQKQLVYGSIGQVAHKFDFSFTTFSTVAKLDYEGFFKASVSYQARDSSSQVEMSEKIWNEKNIVLSHSTSSFEQRSAVNLRWSW